MKRLIVLTALAALFILPGYSQEKKSPSFDEVLTTRRSIRNYDATKKISETEVRELLKLLKKHPLGPTNSPPNTM